MCGAAPTRTPQWEAHQCSGHGLHFWRVRAYADYFCVKKAQRAFKTIATGYSLLQGVLYTGTNVNDATLGSCA
jgi:hypothetical protein